MTAVIIALGLGAVILLASVWLTVGDRRRCEFPNVTHLPVDGEDAS